MVHLLYCYTLFAVVENGVELHGVDGEDAGVGARGVGGRALSRRGAAHARLPHARARHHLPDDRPEPAGSPSSVSLDDYIVICRHGGLLKMGGLLKRLIQHYMRLQ